MGIGHKLVYILEKKNYSHTSNYKHKDNEKIRLYTSMRESEMKTLKSAIKIRNTAKLSCKSTTMILMV